MTISPKPPSANIKELSDSLTALSLKLIQKEIAFEEVVNKAMELEVAHIERCNPIHSTEDELDIKANVRHGLVVFSQMCDEGEVSSDQMIALLDQYLETRRVNKVGGCLSTMSVASTVLERGQPKEAQSLIERLTDTLSLPGEGQEKVYRE